MERLTVHAGLHKTGTTSFQVEARRNTEWLARQGVLFPPPASWFRLPGQHSELVPWLPGAPRFDGTFTAEIQARVEAGLAAIAAQARHGDAPQVLLSGEEFSSAGATTAGVQALAEGLSRHFGQWRLLLVVRAAVPHLASCLMEDAATGRFVAERTQARFWATRRFQRTLGILANFAALLPGRVEFLDYAALVGSGHFCAALCSALTGLDASPFAEVHHNTRAEQLASLPQTLLAPCRAVLGLHHDAMPHSAEVSAALDAMVDPQGFLASVRAPGLAHYQQALCAVVQDLATEAVAASRDQARQLLGAHPHLLDWLALESA